MQDNKQPRRIVIKITLILIIAYLAWGFVLSILDGIKGTTLSNGESPFKSAAGLLVSLIFFGGVLLYVWNKNRLVTAEQEKVEQPILDLGSVVLEAGTERVAYERLLFDNEAKQMKFEGVGTSQIFDFENISKIYTGINIRNPALFFKDKAGNKHTIFFVSSTEGARSLKTVYARSLAMGELSAATSTADANRASYGQFLQDRVLRAEQWLKEHHIQAYRAKMDRNAKVAILTVVWMCLIVPAITMTLIALSSK